MRLRPTFALLTTSLVGIACLSAAPSEARRQDNRSVSIATSPQTGGYCDPAGCPDRFWRLPVHYGPVFYSGRWYRGPVYFRGDRWAREFWVNGGWHRDEWQGRRPSWARQSHDGPALGFGYYADHGFRLGDHWRRQHDWETSRNHDWNNQDANDRNGDFRDHRNDDNRDDGDRGRDDWRDHRNDGDNGDRGRDHRNDDNRDNSDRGDQNDRDHRGDNQDRDHSDRVTSGDHHGRGDNTPVTTPAANVIHVTSATYGATCHQASGNVTNFLSTACNGKGVCEYTVQYQTIGDPAPGCAKDFSVQWTCSAGAGGSTSAPAEAGLGSKVTLQCASGARN